MLRKKLIFIKRKNNLKIEFEKCYETHVTYIVANVLNMKKLKQK